MKLLFYLFFSVLFAATAAFGQQSALFMSLGKPLKTQKSGNIIGSPYLHDDFENADIITASGKKLNNLSLRYNLLNQHIEYYTDNNVYDITDSVKELNLNASENHTGKFIHFKSTNAKVTGFLELVYAGKINLYKLNTVKLESEENFYNKQITKKYVSSYIYYTFSDNEVKKIGFGKKDFLNAFKDNKQVKVFLNNTDLNFNSDASITPLGELINH